MSAVLVNGQVRFTVLGPLGITDGQQTVILPSSKTSVLLASLLLHANTVVPVPYLQRAIWGEDPPETAKAAVQSCVLRLRRLFGSHGIPAGMIETLPYGYRINADAGTLDLMRFRELLRQASAAGNPGAEVALLRQAVLLWRGRALLENVNSDLLQRDLVPRLAEERLQAVERTFDLELALGRCRQVLAETLAMARSHPEHERFCEQLIEALYRTGRRAEALAEYRRVKEHLLEELGIDPGPALQRLELAILRGDSLGPDPGAPGPGTPAPIAPASSTPAPAAAPSGAQVLRLPAAAPSGAKVLRRLLQAGLLEEGPHGEYRMNELLHVFTCVAAGEHNTPALQGADSQRSTRA
ncbi:AfsR/SARP family transcriptional regulator [Kitasatospora sp. NBC_01266]|uniref:AfsR/SARP family transcriptional regulator n=1 Tax=Kitasatospora sp. NBC_01266 TaxID=2903572 RepID=UPI003FA6082F